MKQRIMRSVLSESALPKEIIAIPKYGRVGIELVTKYQIIVHVGQTKDFPNADLTVRGRQFEGLVGFKINQNDGEFTYDPNYVWYERGHRVPTEGAKRFMRTELQAVVRDWAENHRDSVVRTPEQLAAQKRYDYLQSERRSLARSLADVDRELDGLRVTLNIKD